MKFKYIVDSSAVLSFSKYDRYEKEYFTPLWNSFDKKVQEGTIAATDKVYGELIFKDDDIKVWAESNKNIFEIPSPEVNRVSNILKNKFPKWYEYQINRPKSADMELICFAKYHEKVLVTQEGWNFTNKREKEFKIPTICSKIGAYCHIGKVKDDKSKISNGFQCIDLLELIKRENLHEY